MKYLGAFLLLLGLTGLVGNFYLQTQLPALKTEVFELLTEAKEAGMDKNKWEILSQKAKETIPAFPGFFRIRNAFGEAAQIVTSFQTLKEEIFQTETLSESISLGTIHRSFDHLRDIDESLVNIEKAIRSIPDWLATEDLLLQKENGQDRITFLRQSIALILNLESVVDQWAKNEDRFIVIFQNPNEPRSTGGFMGSLLVIDFLPEMVNWKFQDIYAIDRKIPQEKLVLTPDWFHGLSRNLSLRDANFWPDFPTSAEAIRNFFTLAKEKSPGTVIAITPEWVKVWLTLIDGTRIPKWSMDFTPENFDLVLQFLVESKIEGRWGTKNPLMRLAEEIFAPYAMARITPQKVAAIDWNSLVSGKHILAHSQDKKLQAVFEQLHIAGHLKTEPEVDNFLAFDFISIGANKSEKFMWTRMEHNSLIAPDGTVENTLKIKRTHALRQGEISQQLGENNWEQNIKDLLTADVLWKLGSGENRTMLRVWVPADTEFLSGSSPSGSVRALPRSENDFTMIEIPMNVLPGESLTAEVKYKTHIPRGSHNWRPYNLQIVGTPARKQTKLISTISTQERGKFTAESAIIGAPISLTDENVRAVVEW